MEKELERKPGETDEEYAKRLALREYNKKRYYQKKHNIKPVIGVYKIIRKPGCKMRIESFDKYNTKCFCVTFYLRLEPIKRLTENLVKLKYLDSDIRDLFYNWFKAQGEYEAYLCVPRVSKFLSPYDGKSSIVSIDLTLKLKNATVFSDVYKKFESLSDSLYSSLKSTFDSIEMPLKGA